MSAICRHALTLRHRCSYPSGPMRAAAIAAMLLPLSGQAVTVDLRSQFEEFGMTMDFPGFSVTGQLSNGASAPLWRTTDGLGIDNGLLWDVRSNQSLWFDFTATNVFAGIGVDAVLFGGQSVQVAVEAYAPSGGWLGRQELTLSDFNRRIELGGYFGQHSVGRFSLTTLSMSHSTGFWTRSISFDQLARDTHWIGSGTGQWDTARNWSSGTSPKDGQSADLRPGTGGTVYGPSNHTRVADLTVGTAPQGRTVLQMGTGDLNASNSVTLERNTELRLSGVSVTAPYVSNHGQIRGGGQVGSDHFFNAVGARLIVSQGERTVVSTSSFASNYGAIDNLGGEVEFERLYNAGQINSQGILRVGSAADPSSRLHNVGQLRFTSGQSQFFGAIYNDYSGQIQLAGHAEVYFFDEVVNDGSIFISGGSFAGMAVFFGGLSGNGSITGGGSVVVEGMLAPTLSMNIAGQLRLGDAAGFAIDGAAGGMERVSVQGTAELDGALALNLASGGWGSGGQFTVLSATGGITGQFDGLMDGAKVGSIDGLDFFIRYGSNEVTIFTPVPEPQTYALMAGGLALMGWMQRRRRVRAA